MGCQVGQPCTALAVGSQGEYFRGGWSADVAWCVCCGASKCAVVVLSSQLKLEGGDARKVGVLGA